MNHLVVVSIGPVQSFIGSARKLEDFWSGSFLMSEITRKAIEIVEAANFEKYELIQPTKLDHITADNFDIAGLPNRFLFKVGDVAGLADEMNKIEKEIHESVAEYFKLLISEYFQGTSKGTDIRITGNLKEQIEEQIYNMLELYWAFVPYENDNDFKKEKLELEANLASVKNIRQSSYYVDYGLPCTVCSQRAALRNHKLNEASTYDEMRSSLRILWQQIDDESRKIRKNEHLCAICVAKREQRNHLENKVKEQNIFVETSGFPSVSYFTLSKEKADIEAEEMKTRDYDLNVDVDSLRYYALMKFDGDSMGQWISDANTIEEAKKKTARLTRFSQEGVATALGKKHLRVVYSGGDDVLAVGSIIDVLKFTAEIRENIESEDLGLAQGITGSAGIVIAHATQPLQSVIAQANQAEASSKSYVSTNGKKKDAFTLKFMRRSGHHREITLPFKQLIEDENTLNYILETAAEWQSNKISRNFIYHFQLAFQQMNYEYEKENSLNNRLSFHDKPEMIENEFRRLINNLNYAEGTIIPDELAEELRVLYCNHMGTFDSYIQLLEIISFLADDRFY